MNVLKTYASEALRLARFSKSSLAPIHKLPVEIISTIPYYLDEDEDEDEDGGKNYFDEALIASTHVCRYWREVFTSYSSLWTKLDLSNVDKTRTYIQRSGTAPLEINLIDNKYARGFNEDDFLKGVFSVVLPHIHRLKSVSVRGEDIPNFFEHFHCRMPLLERLKIRIICPGRDQPLDNKLFGGDLSSLRELTLSRIGTHLPWNNLANLRVLELRSFPPEYDITRLLGFLESAPLLGSIRLLGHLPESSSSNAPSNRIVALPNLTDLKIKTNQAHSILLDHLRIPAGASLIQYFILSHLGPLVFHHCMQEGTANLENLSHITTVDLHLDKFKKIVDLSGPSGHLRANVGWEAWGNFPSYNLDRQIIRSLYPTVLSIAEKLSVSKFTQPSPADLDPIFPMLSSMNNLRTLILTECHNKPFITALNPQENPSKRTLCPDLEELVLHAKSWDLFHVEHLVNMTKNRASRGAKRLSSITLVGLDGLSHKKEETDKLEEHVNHVDYRVDNTPPGQGKIARAIAKVVTTVMRATRFEE